MMMIHQREHPKVEVPPPPPWDWEATFEEAVFSPQTNDYFSALKRYLPSSSSSEPDEECEIPFDCDNFRMYEFKIRKCGRGRSHDWTECPYAHPGEKARRRDPRKYHYSGTACPEFRRGSCRKGDSCEFAHGVFECWLHPGRYRTQPCKDGPHCKRRVCFFAHYPHQLRVLPPESPPATATNMRYTGFSPRSVFESFPDSDSPPSELANAMRGLQLGIGIGKVVGPRNMNNVWSPSRNASVCCSGSSLPTTPTGNGLDPWDLVEEVPMERVESGKVLRAKIYAKLSKDNSLDPSPGPTCVPDFQWVSDLLQS